MSRFILTVAAACVPAIGTTAAAAPDARQAIQIRGTRAIGSADFDALRGEYDLADGSRLSILGTRLHPELQLDEAEPVDLVMIGPDQFNDASGALRVRIHTGLNGNVNGLTVTYVGQGQVVAAARM